MNVRHGLWGEEGARGPLSSSQGSGQVGTGQDRRCRLDIHAAPQEVSAWPRAQHPSGYASSGPQAVWVPLTSGECPWDSAPAHGGQSPGGLRTDGLPHGSTPHVWCFSTLFTTHGGKCSLHRSTTHVFTHDSPSLPPGTAFQQL